MEEIRMDPVGILYGDIHPTLVNCSVSGKLRQGDYVKLKHHEDGWVLGKVDAIEAKTNLSIEKSYQIMEGNNVEIQQTISAQIVVIGYLDNKGILQYPRTPFLAGTPVYLADDDFISSTLNVGVGKKGRAYIGLIYGHSIPFSIDINSMVQKHISVMAKTGGGKSYLTGVIIEELIKNDVTVVVIDPHGEYGSMKNKASDSEEMKRFSIHPASYGSRIVTYSPDHGDEKLTFFPPSSVSLGLTSMKRGIGSSGEATKEVPTGSRWISSSEEFVRPSTEFPIAFRSLGLVTFRISCVPHWDSTFLSTFAGLCDTTSNPNPNFLPSEATVLMIFDENAFPC